MPLNEPNQTKEVARTGGTQPLTALWKNSLQTSYCGCGSWSFNVSGSLNLQL